MYDRGDKFLLHPELYQYGRRYTDILKIVLGKIFRDRNLRVQPEMGQNDFSEHIHFLVICGSGSMTKE